MPDEDTGTPEPVEPPPFSLRIPPIKGYLLAIPFAVVLVTLVLFNDWFLHRVQSLLQSLGVYSLNSTEYFSVGLALAGGAILFILALSFLPEYDRVRLAFMLELAGAGIGWILGMFLSPTSASEQQTFLSAKSAIAGIISGYLLSKLQTLFDKAVSDGKLLTQDAVVNGLTFFIPLILSTAAVYSVRVYQDRTILISVEGPDIQRSDDAKGITAYKLSLSKTAHFLAESRLPVNTSVKWSVDPATDHGSIDPDTGQFQSPPVLPSNHTVEVVAMSLEDKSVTSRFPLELVDGDNSSTTEKNAPQASKKN